MEEKGVIFDHDFCYFIQPFSFLFLKEGREMENEVSKIVIKGHTFLFHQFKLSVFIKISLYHAACGIRVIQIAL
jgi:hypothetical protein